jgi:hypothetical protein
MFLSYDNPQSMGNNGYLQSRTRVDPRYRMAGGQHDDISKIQGYSATGEIIKYQDNTVQNIPIKHTVPLRQPAVVKNSKRVKLSSKTKNKGYFW